MAAAAAKAEASAPGSRATPKQKSAAGPPGAAREGFPIMPPSDPKVKELLDQAQARFLTDPKQAGDLLKLAARKGYLPAYMLLGQLAAQVNDEDLVIDALCSLLA